MKAFSKIFNKSNLYPGGVLDIAEPPGYYRKNSPPIETSTWTWGTRETADRIYHDDVAFYGIEQDDGKCMVTGKSRSQTASYYDYHVNFCNIYNGSRIVTRDSKIKFNYNISKLNCKWFLTDYTNCNRY